jgi:CRISPR-associated endonuclease Csn1
MRILGLDLGTNSVGWAVVDKEKDEQFRLIDKGVRIFQEGVKSEKGKEISRAAERTGYRSARRNKYRRKLRKIKLLQALCEFGYCPALSKEELNDWRYKKIYPKNKAFLDWQRTNEESSINPYYFRALAVEQKLDLSQEEERYQLGRAFYHMVQRRGFLSNRLEGTKESEGAVKKSIAEINKAKGSRTLGQFFYEKYLKGEKIRDIYTHREEHYLDEFKTITKFQELPDTFAEKVHKAIFFQRPLKSQKGLIGKCVFETNKPKCPISRPEFEEYRMLCFVNNIKIKTPDDEGLRFLNKDERKKVIPRFYLQREHFNFEDIAKQIAPKKQYKFYKDREKNPEDWLFNYKMNTTVSACPVSARFKDLFGDDYMDVKYNYIREKDGIPSVIDIGDIWHVLFTFDSDEKLKEFAENRLGLNEDNAIGFCKIHLKNEYASLSLKAIKNIIPYLREGLIYSHAVFLANMEKVIPAHIWKDKENRRIIRGEIKEIIKTQNEEKQIVDIVNGFIKKCKNDNDSWSEEASGIYQRKLSESVEMFYGKNYYSRFNQDKQRRILEKTYLHFKEQMQKNMGRGEFKKIQRIDDRVKAFIEDNFDVDKCDLKKLYHPSAIEVYKPALKAEDGKPYLGSPLISSIKNPMAMRALHQLRKVVNELIKNEVIDETTRINIEMARDLMNANERKALKSWQDEREKIHKGYADKILEHFKKNGINAVPTNDEVLKYQLWEEQKHKCIYTGDEISVYEFLGANPGFDIEHTIPRSLSFDNSQENKTLCQSKFNRAIKRNKIPFELDNHKAILARIEPWKEKYEELDKQVQQAVRLSKAATDKELKDRAIQKRHKLTYERNYWRNKYQRFIMEDVPEGFKNSQLVDTGIITKYSRMYLKTVFDKVYTVKGNTVADFRKIWGIQKEYEKKARVNHIHHCIDAITIACITKDNYETLAKFYHEWEEANIAGIDKKPRVEKPWKTFVEDLKLVENEVLVSHYTPDVLPKQSKKKLRKRGKIQYNKQGEPICQKGDTVRGSLHQATFYGAIEQVVVNKKGKEEKQIKYVVRKPLDSLEDTSIKHIVDNNVREIVAKGRIKEKKLKKDIESLKKMLSKAEESEELEIKDSIRKLEVQMLNLYSLTNKNGNPIPIKKVRIYTPSVTNPIQIKKQRDKTKKNPKPYKENFHVANDGNYLMAIYEGRDAKGKIKRDIEIVNNLNAGEFYKLSTQNILKGQGVTDINEVVPKFKTKQKVVMSLKGIVKTGTMVILLKDTSDEIRRLLSQDQLYKRLYKVVKKRLYKVVKMDKDGRITFKFHQLASNDEMLKSDYENQHKSKAPKSLTNGESFVDFEKPFPKLRLSPSKFDFLIEGKDFLISPSGRLKLKKNA